MGPFHWEPLSADPTIEDPGYHSAEGIGRHNHQEVVDYLTTLTG
ncbi:hypothetical protein GCM10009744_29260 [Kribbella alba]|uniref:Uncharacterized protein n=1 Tax=Kribbella alba TaxID=190197 RepID=A0ABN2FAJ8_9ACTN